MARKFTTGCQFGDCEPSTGFYHCLEQISTCNNPLQTGLHHQKCGDVTRETARQLPLDQRVPEPPGWHALHQHMAWAVANISPLRAPRRLFSVLGELSGLGVLWSYQEQLRRSPYSKLMNTMVLLFTLTALTLFFSQHRRSCASREVAFLGPLHRTANCSDSVLVSAQHRCRSVPVGETLHDRVQH